MKPRYPTPAFPGDLYFLFHRERWDCYFVPTSGGGLLLIVAKDGSLSQVPITQADSLLHHFMVAEVKRRNLWRNSLEEKFLPDISKKIFIVQGQCTSETYQETWTVRAFYDYTSAETFAKACQEASEVWRDLYGTTKSPPFSWSLLDPFMQFSFDESPQYFVKGCPIALGSEDLDTSREICPICHSQVYDTPGGLVCENGHEVI